MAGRTAIPLQLRRLVAARADYRCEYCLVSEDDVTIGHTLDHIRPLKHRGPTEADNLAYACVECNQSKGSDVATYDPVSDQLVRLFNPRSDVWRNHFTLDGAKIVGLTPIGRGTVEVLRLNDDSHLEQRLYLQSKRHYPLS